jgi:hypothetical protein
VHTITCMWLRHSSTQTLSVKNVISNLDVTYGALLNSWTLETSCSDSDQESKTNSGVGLKKNQEMNMHEPEEW